MASIVPMTLDYTSYEDFMSNYLRVLADERASRWDNFMKAEEICQERNSIRAQSPDIDRTFPDNIHFTNKQDDLRPALYNVLVALRQTQPKNRGLNYIAGLMLLIVRKEEAAFWLLDVIVGNILPDYYAKDMFGLQVEQEALREVVRAKMPDLFEHIEKLGVSYTIFSTKWFICLYIDVLPVETVLRIWDCLFYEGSKVILRVALTLLSLNKEKLLACRDFTQLCTAMKVRKKNSSDENPERLKVLDISP
ncbi:Growth hormone-regulated TBC protein 1 [Desmophyllum pertusum]|uniref:Growth hormone-regulated TBC protein 1 n=1 Tax=Desmophyllum pertusum TaxID=174260 RepID=A0A9W9ZL73_9CNID|nr:Growth hormone-regulated TBC protein 1 [Desmophyllum pertusum]